MPVKRSIRSLIALAWVILAVAYIVRSSFVAAYADTDLKRAERLWPGHPSVLEGRAMINIAGAAAAGRGLDSETRHLIADLARTEPLAPQPFLITGAEALRDSRSGQAERLLLLARQRNPRAPAPRLLLAEKYISEGRIREGVPEAAVLGKLVPGSLEPLSQAFARYIQTSGVPDGMDEVMGSNVDLSTRILNELAADPDNADLLLKIAALAPPRPRGPAPPWQTQLISQLVAAEDYQKARLVWSKFAGGEADMSANIQDARFKGSFAAPPFNWTYATQGAVIEPRGGSLHILYFGRDDETLASQLLVLRPGSYRLEMTISGQLSDPQTLNWKIICLHDKRVILDRSIGQAGALDWSVDVSSSGCGAQQLELSAKANDAGRSSDFMISDLNLTARRGQ